MTPAVYTLARNAAGREVSGLSRRVSTLRRLAAIDRPRSAAIKFDQTALNRRDQGRDFHLARGRVWRYGAKQVKWKSVSKSVGTAIWPTAATNSVDLRNSTR